MPPWQLSNSLFLIIIILFGEINVPGYLSFLFREDEALLCKAREGWRVLEAFNFFRDPGEGVGATGRV